MDPLNTPIALWQHVLDTCRTRWRFVALTVVCTIAGALLTTSQDEPGFEATAVVLLDTAGAGAATFGGVEVGTFVPPTRRLATQMALLRSNDLNSAVARRLGGRTTPDELRRSVDFSLSGYSRTVRVSATSKHQNTAQQIADGYANEYVAFRRRLDRDVLTGAIQTASSDRAQNLVDDLQLLRALQTGDAEIVVKRPSACARRCGSVAEDRRCGGHHWISPCPDHGRAPSAQWPAKRVGARSRGIARCARARPSDASAPGTRGEWAPSVEASASDALTSLRFLASVQGRRIGVLSPHGLEHCRATCATLAQAGRVAGRAIALTEATDDPAGTSHPAFSRSSVTRDREADPVEHVEEHELHLCAVPLVSNTFTNSRRLDNCDAVIVSVDLARISRRSLGVLSARLEPSRTTIDGFLVTHQSRTSPSP